jgi:hypothetical protein
MTKISNVFYVYHLIDPRTDTVFYVGKGKGNRANEHLTGRNRNENPFKDNVISKIREAGFEPSIVKVFENLENEEACQLERQEIIKYGRRKFDKDGILTNLCIDANPPSAKGRPASSVVKERMRTNNPHKPGEKSHRLGLKHTEETKKDMSDKQKTAWANFSKEERSARNKKAWETRRRGA